MHHPGPSPFRNEGLIFPAARNVLCRQTSAVSHLQALPQLTIPLKVTPPGGASHTVRGQRSGYQSISLWPPPGSTLRHHFPFRIPCRVGLGSQGHCTVIQLLPRPNPASFSSTGVNCMNIAQ